MKHDVEVLHPYCCGLDVHKKVISACILTPTTKQRKRFGTMTDDLHELANWLKQHSVTIVAMESTGVYWKPVYNILEESGLEMQVVNAQHIKTVPGRKTDTTDAEWIATLLRIGLLKSSFIPSRQQRELRDISRYRLAMVQERSREIQRVQKILESANIKIGSLISDVNNVSGRLMIQAIIEGQLEPAEISTLGHPKLKYSPEEYAKALKGRVSAVHQNLLSLQLCHIDELTQRIMVLDKKLEELTAQIPNFNESLELIDTIPGVGRQSAMTILIEIGLDMSRFPTVKHLAAWAGVAPGNRESAGKSKPEKSRKGNKYLKAVLVQSAHSLHKKKNCHLREQYQRIKARRGGKKAAVAVAHSILRIIFYLLTRNEPYQELGANYVSEKNKCSQIQRYVKELAKLGLVVPNELVSQQLAISA